MARAQSESAIITGQSGHGRGGFPANMKRSFVGCIFLPFRRRVILEESQAETNNQPRLRADGWMQSLPAGLTAHFGGRGLAFRGRGLGSNIFGSGDR